MISFFMEIGGFGRVCVLVVMDIFMVVILVFIIVVFLDQDKYCMYLIKGIVGMVEQFQCKIVKFGYVYQGFCGDYGQKL